MPTEPGGRARDASGLFASGDAPEAPQLGAGLSDDPAENRISLIYRAYKDVTPDDAAHTALLAQSFGTSFEFARRNRELLRQRYDEQSMRDTLRAAPHLASFLQTPEHAALSRDSLSFMAQIEQSFQVPQGPGQTRYFERYDNPLLAGFLEVADKAPEAAWQGLALSGKNLYFGSQLAALEQLRRDEIEDALYGNDDLYDFVEDFTLTHFDSDFAVTATAFGRAAYDTVEFAVGLLPPVMAFNAASRLFGWGGNKREAIDYDAPEFQGRFQQIDGLVARQLDGLRRADAHYKLHRPQGETFITNAMLSGIESLGRSAPSLLVGVATGGTGALLVSGLQAFSDSYAEGRVAGLDHEAGLSFGALNALVEVGTERIPFTKLFDKSGSTLRRRLIDYLVSDQIGEQIATHTQDAIKWQYLNPEKSFQEFLAERPAAAAATMIATLTAGAPSTLIMGAADKRRQIMEDARTLDLADRLSAAREAYGAAPLTQRTPEKAREFLATVTKDERVLLDSEGLKTLFNADPKKATKIFEKAGLTSQDLRDAGAGMDVSVPVAKLIKLKDGFTDLIGIVRPEPGLPTPNEIRDRVPDDQSAVIRDADARYEAADRKRAAEAERLAEVAGRQKAAGKSAETVRMGNVIYAAFGAPDPKPAGRPVEGPSPASDLRGTASSANTQFNAGPAQAGELLSPGADTSSGRISAYAGDTSPGSPAVNSAEFQSDYDDTPIAVGQSFTPRAQRAETAHTENLDGGPPPDDPGGSDGEGPRDPQAELEDILYNPANYKRLSRLKRGDSFAGRLTELFLEAHAALDGHSEKSTAIMAELRKFAGVETNADLIAAHGKALGKLFYTYLSEGGLQEDRLKAVFNKAPTKELWTVFSRFWLWFARVWKKMRGEPLKLSADVRQIFDRVVFTESQIAKARREFGLDGSETLRKLMDEKGKNRYDSAISALSEGAKSRLAIQLIRHEAEHNLGRLPPIDPKLIHKLSVEALFSAEVRDILSTERRALGKRLGRAVSELNLPKLDQQARSDAEGLSVGRLRDPVSYALKFKQLHEGTIKAAHGIKSDTSNEHLKTATKLAFQSLRIFETARLVFEAEPQLKKLDQDVERLSVVGVTVPPLEHMTLSDAQKVVTDLLEEAGLPQVERDPDISLDELFGDEDRAKSPDIDHSVVELDPMKVRFTQSWVSWRKGKSAWTFRDLYEAMQANGWDDRRDPVDVVIMPDGKMTSLDNTRLVVARLTGTPIKARVHQFDDPILDQERRNSLKWKEEGVFQYPANWGEALQRRIQSAVQGVLKQNGGIENWSGQNPDGADSLPNVWIEPTETDAEHWQRWLGEVLSAHLNDNND